MELSIIVPVHNMAAEGKLNYCLDSLIAQTIRDYEIIAVDDASTDHSLEILREYEKNYPDRFIVIAQKENHRQGSAKNAGLRICRGDFIGFVDSDDWFSPDAFERLVTLARQQDADIACCDLSLVWEQTMTPGKVVPSFSPENAGELTEKKRRELILGYGALVTKVYRRRIFREPELYFLEDGFYEDNALSVEILMRANKIAYLQEPLYFYYQHDASTVHVISEERCMDRMKAMRIMLELAKNGGYLETYRTELECRFAELFYKITLFSYLQGVKKVRSAFVKALGNEMKETFPGFLENPRFLKRTDPEERKMMRLQQKSTFLFLIYYRLLWTYRNLRKR